ncbi:cell division suppressor protein YneA [Peribacillus deserti]|uniref:Cell division suppressor protein YneA n=1 Tax=Peribacillus deserti TaxID=673318 RepID=A0A2N5M194_9BACI|nr:LysM peptidoglycan-binding domain-containing protein [Peribacillus deserti]PLT28138.1 cell division suppressor protein YneA [Peribacillus deserti]
MKNLWKNHTYTISFLAIIFVFSLVFLQKSEETYKSSTVTVAEGDTLWTIAERYETNDLPMEKMISWIEENNNISNGVIRAGDEIMIPFTLDAGSGNLASQ